MHRGGRQELLVVRRVEDEVHAFEHRGDLRRVVPLVAGVIAPSAIQQQDRERERQR